MPDCQRDRGRGFTLREVLVVVLIVVVLVVVLSLAMERNRRLHRRAICEGSQRAIGINISNYASDYKDRIISLSWRAGQISPLEPNSTLDPKTDLEAVADEVVDMMRFRTDRTDVAPIRGWLPGPRYTLITIMSEYIGDRFPRSIGTCPEDGPRQTFLWKLELGNDPFVRPPVPGYPLPPPIESEAAKRWPYSSSYELVPATYSPDHAVGGVPTISQGGRDGEYLVPRVQPFGPAARKLSEVSFPGMKVGMFDSHDRHSGGTPRFFADPKARQPLMFFDTSVRVMRTGDADPGFQPNRPDDPGATVFDYDPEPEAASWYPPPVNPGGDRGFKGYYRWTRGGLKGWDFGGTGAVVLPGAEEMEEGVFERVVR